MPAPGWAGEYLGNHDPVADVDQARKLARKLEEAGTSVTIVVFPGVGHGIPRDQRTPHIEALLKKVFSKD